MRVLCLCFLTSMSVAEIYLHRLAITSNLILKKSHSSGPESINNGVSLEERFVWANLKCLWESGLHSGILH